MSIRKRLLSIITTVAMLTAVLPVNAYAIDIDKTAKSTLDENNQTTVTLNVGGTQDVENVAVLFVLDYSTSVNVRNAAGTFLTELANKKNTNVKAAVVDYSSVAAATGWTAIDKDTDTSAETGLLKSQTSSGTNYHAGLLKAQELLKSSEIKDYTTYLITISDGITYLWTDETTGDTMSVYTSMWSPSVYDEATSTKWNDNQVNTYRVITKDRFAELVAGGADVQAALSASEKIAVEWGTSYDSSMGYVSYQDFQDHTKLIGSEVAICKTTSVYNKLLDAVDYAYAFKLDESHWTDFPYGEYLMDYLIGVSDNSGDTKNGVISNDTAKTVFSTIKDQILYEIMSGTVTDVIGEDFDWVSMNTVKLTVGGTELTGTVSDNTVSFDNGNYVVTYYAATDSSDECFTWEIKTPVEAANGLTLSYELALSESYELPENGTAVLDTNESAKIEYKDPDGEDKEEEFPVPHVVIGGEKTSESGMDKTIVVKNEDGTTSEVDKDDVAAGSTVDFALDSTIPDGLKEHITFTYGEDGTAVGTVNSTTEGGADTYYLTFHDEMDDGLNLAEDSIAVAIDDVALDNKYYTVTTSNNDGCTFEVSVELLQLYTDKIISYSDIGAATITVTYSAILSKNATAGSYLNKAWVTYNEEKSEEDSVEVITYGIKIYKVNSALASPSSASSSDAASRLNGATFVLYDSDGKEIETVTTGTIGEEKGIAIINGLDAGTYYLEETSSPDGYVSSKSRLTITIPEKVDEGTYIVTVGIGNAPIPSTGGAGTRMYLIGGACLIVAAGTVFIVSRRKKED